MVLSPSPFASPLRRLVVAGAMAWALVGLATPPSHAEARHVTPRSAPLLAVASRYIGSGNFTHFRGPWCAAAVDRWLALAGFHSLHSLRAIDYARYGRRSGPVPGALAVMRHHIGIVVGFSRHGLVVLSGNHRHRVGLGVYAPWRIVAFRQPV